MPQVGKLEEVELRQAWAHEALGFSAWMEQNLDVLAEALGRSFTFLERTHGRKL